jgi:hypothetical protein
VWDKSEGEGEEMDAGGLTRKIWENFKDQNVWKIAWQEQQLSTIFAAM